MKVFVQTWTLNSNIISTLNADRRAWGDAEEEQFHSLFPCSYSTHLYHLPPHWLTPLKSALPLASLHVQWSLLTLPGNESMKMASRLRKSTQILLIQLAGVGNCCHNTDSALSDVIAMTGNKHVERVAQSCSFWLFMALKCKKNHWQILKRYCCYLYLAGHCLLWWRLATNTWWNAQWEDCI